MAGARVRHDRLVRVASELALQCGVAARVHDGPIFDLGPLSPDRRKRPADWFERGGEMTQADTSRYYGGRCCDLTITTGGAAQLDGAVAAKLRKYAPAMVAHPHLALTVFGISFNGRVSDGGSSTLKRWATCLARSRKMSADLPGTPWKEVTSAFGLAFAIVVALQTSSYIEEMYRSGSARKRAPEWQRVDVPGSKRKPGTDGVGGGQGGNDLTANVGVVDCGDTGSTVRGAFQPSHLSLSGDVT